MMRPDISYYNNTNEPVENDEDNDGMEVEQEASKPKSKSKGLTEIKIEYSKRRADENHFGPLSYAEVAAARNEEPWVVAIHQSSEA